MVVMVIMFGDLPHTICLPQLQPTPNGQPYTDGRNRSIADRRKPILCRAHHGLAPKAQQPDPKIDKYNRRERLRQARQHGQCRQPRQRHPLGHAITPDEDFPVSRPDRVKEPITETHRHQRANGPRLFGPKRPQPACHTVLCRALSFDRPPFDPERAVKHPQPGGEGNKTQRG